MIARLAIALVALMVGIGVGAPTSAGGWAVGSLDEVPDARSGGTEQIGFTILQHGITPAQLDPGVDGDVGIEIVGADGSVTFFEAVPAGDVGHYVAAITFPESGDYTWSIRMGWFPAQELGALAVTSTASSSNVDALWGSARWALLGVTVLLASVAITDLFRGRRRTAAIST